MKTAVSIIMFRSMDDIEVYWVRRGESAPFLSDFHSFPGGFVDDIDLEFADGDEDVAHRIAGIREVYEETGFVPTLVPERDIGPRTKAPFDTLGLSLDDFLLDDLVDIGDWASPSYLVTEFRTRFFLVHADTLAPLAMVGDGEVLGGDWIRPADALELWDSRQTLLAPPTRFILEALTRKGACDEGLPSITLPKEALTQHPTYSAIRPDIMLIPLKTPTLPPATHTNCYVLGTNDLWIVEPAAYDIAELNFLYSYLDRAIGEGATIRGIVLTHHHHDHIGGVEETMSRYGVGCWAHKKTADRVSFPIQSFLEEGDKLPFTGERDWEVIFTPGHAPGHICLFSDLDNTLIVGDMVAGFGTILIEPNDGDMIQYLDSKEISCTSISQHN